MDAFLTGLSAGVTLTGGMIVVGFLVWQTLELADTVIRYATGRRTA